MKKQTIEETILAHEARNAALRRVLEEKRVDPTEARSIQCHFWTWSPVDAAALAADLRDRGFKILVQSPAALKDDPNRWNVESEIQQTINLTTRREFIEELVRLASSRNSTFDGGGTLI